MGRSSFTQTATLITLKSMKLNEKEAKILASVEWAADKQLSEIAKETGYQEHTVRYYLRRMEEAGVIERVPFMDLSSLGYQYVGIFFSIGLPPEKVPDALKSLTALPEVVWLAELGGDYQFGLGLCVQHVSHVQNFHFNDYYRGISGTDSEHGQESH